jgi:RNA polymerase sigma-70 factor (ECF subfamily)
MDDRNLVERTGAGDGRAFEALVRRWEGPLLRFLRRLTGSAAGADEARQATLIRVYRGAAAFRGGSVAVWLFRTAHRVARNLRREAARTEPPREPAVEPRDPAPAPEAQAAGAEERAALHAALGRLRAEDRAALWLRIGEGLSLKETARALGVPPSTLRHRLQRALVRVRREIVRGERHGVS